MLLPLCYGIAGLYHRVIPKATGECWTIDGWRIEWRKE